MTPAIPPTDSDNERAAGRVTSTTSNPMPSPATLSRQPSRSASTVSMYGVHPDYRMQATPVGNSSLKVRISVAAPSPNFPATNAAAAGVQNVRTDLALSPERMEVDSHRRNQFSDIYGDDDGDQPPDDDGNSTDTAGREIEAVSDDDQTAPAEKEKGVEKGGDEEESPQN